MGRVQGQFCMSNETEVAFDNAVTSLLILSSSLKILVFFPRFFFVVFYFPAPFSSLLYSLVLLRFPNSSLTYISGAASPVSPSPSLAVIIHYHQIIPVNWSFVRISFRIIKALKAVLFWCHWKCQRIRSKFNFAVHLIFLTYFLWRTFSIYIRVRFQLDPSLTPAIHIIK